MNMKSVVMFAFGVIVGLCLLVGYSNFVVPSLVQTTTPVDVIYYE